MRKCAHCGKELGESALFCGNCGANVERERLPHFRRRARSLTKVVWLDMLLGALIVLGLTFGAMAWGGIVWMLPVFLGLCAYQLLRDTYPDFAKGIKTGLSVLAVLVGLLFVLALGALAFCIATAGRNH
jgi:hypothetical protein